MKELILLHGALGHSNQFEPLLPHLSRDFTIHAFSFAGHGTEEIPAQGILMQDYVTQLQTYCVENKLERPAIFGYSMGGYVALCYAAQYPGKVSSILTLATKLDWTREGAVKEAGMLVPDVIAAKVPKYAAQLAALHGSEKWKQLLPAIAGMMVHLGEQPLLTSRELASLDIPVQLMVGDKDNMVGIDETRTAAAGIPGARFAVLPGTKHPFEQVKKDLLLALINDFLETAKQ